MDEARREQLDALLSQGRLDAAAELCRSACAGGAGDADACFTLGLIHGRRGELSAAERCFREILQRSPESAEAWFNLGRVHAILGRQDEALACYRRAVALAPGFGEAYGNLANAFLWLGLTAEAEQAYRRALELPLDLGNRRLHLDLKPQDLDRKRTELHSALLFLASYNVLYSPAAMLEAHRDWDRRHGSAGRARMFHHAGGGTGERRLRVGYVSPDLRHHSVSFFFEPLLAAHHRSRVEVYCYAEVARPDAVTARLQARADHWRSSVGLSDADLARRIHDDRIDVLVDLAGHTAGNRLGAFTYRPAPVQATYLGYFSTTGLAAMDYWITDAVLTPPDSVEQATESLFRLPRCCLCYAGPPEAPAVSERAADQPVTFGSFNDLSKISPAAVALWARVLHAVPGSSLLLKARQFALPAACERLTRDFGAHGVAPERLRFRGMTASPQDHLALYGAIDIALDTVPRTGGTTTAEALWMGVPVVTLAGARFIERLSATMLEALALPELIARDAEEFVAKAVTLARDPARRRDLRAVLRARMAASPLCDARGLAEALEDAYAVMWREKVLRTKD